MANSRKSLREKVKEQYVKKLMEFFAQEEDVLRVGSNEIAFPITDEEGNEDFLVIKASIPIGANKGTEPYDGYAMAEDYEIRMREKSEQAEKKRIEKEKKIKRDEEYRRKKKEAKEKREENSN